MIPVLVSLWVTVMTSYFPVERYLSTISGVVGCPHSASCLSAGTLFASAILYQRLPKAPTEKTIARFAVNDRIDPSINPDPELVESTIGFFVYITLRSFSLISR